MVPKVLKREKVLYIMDLLVEVFVLSVLTPLDIDDESDLKRVAGKLCRGEQGRCGRHGGEPSVRLQRTGIIMISIWADAK